MGHTLSVPVTSQHVRRRGHASYRIGSGEMQGFRKTMEDALTIQTSLQDHPELSMFGVYDGHAGERASKYLARHLPGRINALANPMDTKALEKAILRLDADFCNNMGERQEGSTCIVALVKNPREKDSKRKRGKRKKWSILVSNVGDSRAILATKKGKIIKLSEDHKPTRLEEHRRIVSAGGTVLFGRVDGQLAMSRAFGDYMYKSDPSRPPSKQKVIAVPEFKTIRAYVTLLRHCYNPTDGHAYMRSSWTYEKVLKIISTLQARRRQLDSFLRWARGTVNQSAGFVLHASLFCSNVYF